MTSNNKRDKMVWAGRVVTVLVALPFFLSAFMKFSGNPKMVQGWNHLGWPESMVTVIAILEITSVLLYLVPQTSTLGAILMTGYLGGAIATHLRIGEPVFMQVLFGVLIWGGLYLRESSLRQILPIRKLSD
ncbi:MAG: DoxX family protein [Nitrospirae bacterium]|nr:DoxX family protein [Nitrospirota bacterium]